MWEVVNRERKKRKRVNMEIEMRIEGAFYGTVERKKGKGGKGGEG